MMRLTPCWALNREDSFSRPYWLMNLALAWCRYANQGNYHIKQSAKPTNWSMAPALLRSTLTLLETGSGYSLSTISWRPEAPFWPRLIWLKNWERSLWDAVF